MYCSVFMEGRLHKVCDVLCECDDADATWFDSDFGGLVRKAGGDPNTETNNTTSFPSVFSLLYGGQRASWKRS